MHPSLDATRENQIMARDSRRLGMPRRVERAEFHDTLERRGDHSRVEDFRWQPILLGSAEGEEFLCFGGVWRGRFWIGDHGHRGGEDVLLFDFNKVVDMFPDHINIKSLAVRPEGLRPDDGNHVGEVHYFFPVDDIIAAEPEVEGLLRQIESQAKRKSVDPGPMPPAEPADRADPELPS